MIFKDEEMTEDREDIRVDLFRELFIKHKGIIDFIKTSPMDELHKTLAINQLYLGYLAAQAGIGLIGHKPEEHSEPVIN